MKVFFNVMVALLALLLATAGCGGAKPGFVLQVERVSQGSPTPSGQKVEKPTFSASQPSITLGQGAWESGGVGGTIVGPGTRPDGKAERVYKRLPP